MKSINDLFMSCRILDVIEAPSQQIVFVPKEEFDKRYGFVLPTTKGGKFKYTHLGKENNFDVIATIDTGGYNFIFIDPSQISPTKTSPKQ